jgi:hypothetical protein
VEPIGEVLVLVLTNLRQSRLTEHCGFGVMDFAVALETAQLQIDPVQFKQFLVGQIGRA